MLKTILGYLGYVPAIELSALQNRITTIQGYRVADKKSWDAQSKAALESSQSLQSALEKANAQLRDDKQYTDLGRRRHATIQAENARRKAARKAK